ncbi:sterol desaturase family protein [Paenibacillus alkalitolerans]|uniref:sterol desaturase family protein n=1 Tax=Paenibacillus alkalitolerans TaxID=2799335 RepID=UPI0018F6A4EC|nr:sterol desaturase family protein [Paenibacillus alkalitolerans]
MGRVRHFFGHRLIVFLAFVMLVSFCGMYGSISTASVWIGAIVGGSIFLTLEYIVHRFLLHEFPGVWPSAYEGHILHHRYPNDAKYLFGPVRYDLAGYAILFGVSYVAAQDAYTASAVVFGASVCQMFYQWQHYAAHSPVKPLTPWGKFMRKWHLRHHSKNPDGWYGVSNPFLDMLFRSDSASKSEETTSKSVQG